MEVSHFYRVINNKNIIDPKDAFYFQWHFLEKCNLRCSHCYQKDYYAETLSVNNLLKIAQSLDVAMEKWHKQGRISLTGGEPFIKLDLLFWGSAQQVVVIKLCYNDIVLIEESSYVLLEMWFHAYHQKWFYSQ